MPRFVERMIRSAKEALAELTGLAVGLIAIGLASVLMLVIGIGLHDFVFRASILESRIEIFLARYPSYASWPKDKLLHALHDKFYPDIPLDEFEKRANEPDQSQAAYVFVKYRGLSRSAISNAILFTEAASFTTSAMTFKTDMC
jgi:hypothetical protein